MSKDTQLPIPFIEQIITTLGQENVLTDPSECWSYSYDNSRRQGHADLVAFPDSHEQCLTLVKLCYEFNIPLTARGRGTGTTGGTVPLRGGVILSTEKLNRILRVDAANRYMVVEPGVTNAEVQQAAAQHGFFWAPDPSSGAFCSVGGNLGFGAAGPRAVKYGTTRENTLGLRAITGDGKQLRAGVYTSKGVVGYDLTRLLIGSEGTLAIITEATLKLTPLPEARCTLRAVYQDIDSAALAVTQIMAQPMTPCALEFMDHQAIDMIRQYSQVELPQHAGAILLIDIDGPKSAMDEAVACIHRAATNPSLVEWIRAHSTEQAKQLWNTRKALSPALRKVAPKKINEDVVVPVSKIPDLLQGMQKLATQYQLININFGHAGNGNIHVNLLLDPDNPTQVKNAQACLAQTFALVLKLDGTLSGEHGVGMEKRDFIAQEIDPTTLDLMRAIKKQFDPKGILNPGKVFPAQEGY